MVSRLTDMADRGVSPMRGLYDPALDKDSCGVGFIADIKGRKSHRIVQDALTILLNLEHRGAVGADPRAGDGAGILVQIPHRFFARKTAELGFTLPAPGQYGVGYVFMPHDPQARQTILYIFAEAVPRGPLDPGRVRVGAIRQSAHAGAGREQPRCLFILVAA